MPDFVLREKQVLLKHRNISSACTKAKDAP